MGEKNTIVILDGHTINPGDASWEPLSALGECLVYDRTQPELIVERSREARILLTSKCVLDAVVLESLPRLEYVSILATGCNNVDLRAAGQRGIAVSNVPAYATEAVAQAVFALLLELASAVGSHDAAVRTGEWSRCPDFCFYRKPIVELNGLTIGVVGYGSTGQAVARIAAAFGMRVIVHVQRMPKSLGSLPVRFVPLEELFGTADVVSLNCPLTSETSGFVNARLLAVMKPGAFLINTSRGGLIQEADLAWALRSGTIAGAGLDVLAQEPPREDNPLLSAPNCVITPHNAWASLAARRRLVELAAVNVASFLAGAPVNLVNTPYLAVDD